MLKKLASLVLMLLPLCSFAQQPLDNSEQLVVVVTPNWAAISGQLIQYSRDSPTGKWQQVSNIKPVVVGKKGMAWGLGLHDHVAKNNDPVKREGDLTAPAGIFTFGTLFGHATATLTNMPYVKLNDNIEAVDDPNSKYYNQIVDTKRIKQPDWNSSEKMGSIAVYEQGVVINHNAEKPQPNAGSQVFMRVWQNATTGTAGGTAMSRADMHEVFHWLNDTKHPKLVQLPLAKYKELEQQWQLPALPIAVEDQLAKR